MSTSTAMTLIDEYLERVAAVFTPEVAQQVAAMRATPAQQARMDELAGKANAGTLTATERDEYLARIEALDFISIIQSKARRALAHRRT